MRAFAKAMSTTSPSRARRPIIRPALRLLAAFAIAAPLWTGAAAVPQTENARLKAEAQRVTITRDDWGIAHVRGPTDADAVFGMVYAQAEDDFNRVETNYLTNLGWLSLAEGEGAVWQDLRQRLYVDETDLKTKYWASPLWLRRLMDAWSDGLNYYLLTHPDVRPRALTHFEPWMALSFTEGSIGGDIERVPLTDLQAFYGNGPKVAAAAPAEREPRGSNGVAVAPSNTADRHALLLINPHTSFFFRSELQATSGEGLNAYGAATWGQFFIYQGFNDRLGWMHTSSGVDVVDEFVETIVRRNGKLFYRYGKELRPVQVRTVTISYRTASGGHAARSFTVYRTHHGPIVRGQGGKWVAFAMMYKPVEALEQSFLRTKARDYRSYMQVMELKANSSNNTIYADADGNIAYLHPQFIPRRDDRFDYSRPVDGSDPATDWKGLHALTEAPRLFDPSSGWLYNSNNWPYSAAGASSPRRDAFPRYMDTAGENPRGLHAQLLLKDRRDFTLERLRAAAYDSYLTAFAELIPGLIAAYDRAPDARVAAQVALLRGWDYRWSAASEPTSLAVFWGEELVKRVSGGQFGPGLSSYAAMARAADAVKLDSLAAASDRLQRDFGSWRVPWGNINRFQRLTGDIVQPFSDSGPSIPVAFASARWGSLASFGARAYPQTKRWYGTSGNSFVAVVEFGPRVRARAVTAGGESGHPGSPHFNDQAERYATGNLREVYFYPDQLAGHTERVYHPGR
jgi:acyl-homoserine-lactone acylase